MLISVMTFLFCCWGLASAGQAGSVQSANIIVHYDKTAGPVEPVWMYFGYDEANYTYGQDGLRMLDEIAKLSPQPAYIRCHHLLTSGSGKPWLKWSSTNIYTETPDGKPVYDYTITDRIFDAYIQRGLKPLVEFGFMPEAISSKTEPYTPKEIQHGVPNGMVGEGGAYYPPADYQKWQELIERWVEHCVAKYGRQEVESWLWELWNEPNIHYWKGTLEEYCKLYDYTAAGLKKVLPKAVIGGPHVTCPQSGGADKFMNAFLKHCVSGTNYVTGRRGTPIDFIGFHAKGGTKMVDGHVRMNAGNQLRCIDEGCRIAASFAELKSKPIIIGESDPEGGAAYSASVRPENAYRNGSQYAAYTAATFLRKTDIAARHGVFLQGAVTWAFVFENQPWFDGFRTLSTNGVIKPVFNAFRMFSKLEGNRVIVDTPDGFTLDEFIAKSASGDKSDVSAYAARNENRLNVVVWNYHDDAGGGPSAQVKLNIDGLPKDIKSARLTHYRIDDQHSNSFAEWQKINSPQNPTAAQIAQLQKASELAEIQPAGAQKIRDGTAEILFSLPRQAVSMLCLEW